MISSMLLLFLLMAPALCFAAGKRGLLFDYTVQDANPNAIYSIPTNAQITRVANWNTWYPKNLNNRIPFVPTIRTPAQLQGQEWDWVWNSNGPEAFYYNEPERIPVSPEDAARMWFSHMIPLRQQTGKKLVGPGIANDEAGKRWLERFMSLIGNEKPNYLGLHVYETDGDRAIRYMQEMYAKYRIPLYITEIASVSRNYIDVLYFTAQLANWMDDTPWVEKYFFFGWMPRCADNFVSPAAQLMNSDTSNRDLMMKLVYDKPINANMNEVAKGTGANAYR